MARRTVMPVEEYLTTNWESDRDYIDGEVQERHCGTYSHNRTITELMLGVAHVWVIDPITKCAWTITHFHCWSSVTDGVLRTQNPSIEVALAEIFS